MLYEYLSKSYLPGEPIFSTDIKLNNMSNVNLRQQLKLLTDSGKLARYDQGVYYIPKRSIMRGAGGPTADSVAYHKYISCKNGICGYYSGYTFANQIGLTAQVPQKLEIVTNNIAAKRREVEIKKRSFILRKSNIFVTNENYKVLQFLDLLKNLEKYVDYGNNTEKKLADYVMRCQITREELNCYISYYPDSTYRYFYEMRLEYVLT